METVDKLVARYLETEDELGLLGKTIAGSSKQLAIVFVDLSGSTELKHNVTTAKWLGYVVRFIEITTAAAKRTGGTVVKRIGDELMITFDRAPAAESFVSDVLVNQDLANFSFKVGLDWGETFGLSFGSGQPYDPYGPIVDRAARIAKLATRGLVLASKSFAEAAGTTAYSTIGKFALKGLPQPEELYVRTSSDLDKQRYVQRILESLQKDKVSTRFRYRPREFTLRDFDISERRHSGFPFLARELLALPRLPFSFPDFTALRENNLAAAREYLSYIVEWEMTFFSATERSSEHAISVLLHHRTSTVAVTLHPNMADVARTFTRDAAVVVRGVLVSIGPYDVELDYADIQPAA
jgi:class 3 adenylate cyclase